MKVSSFGMPRGEIRAELDRIRHPMRIAVERAKNPFNIGSIVRTAHSFLAREIILIGTEPWYERAGMGMQRFENIVEVPDEGAFLELATERGWNLVAFEREPAPVGLWEAEFPQEPCLMFGNEDHGLSDELIEAADLVVSIPMFGINHSYPISIAAGIAMAEWTRRHYAGGRVINPP